MPTSVKPVYLYDTTLRDGTQGEGFQLSGLDKLRIAERLDQFGVDYIEGGWPGSNPKDVEFFREAKKLKLSHAKLAAFGSTRRADTPVEQDPQVALLLDAETPVVTIEQRQLRAVRRAGSIIWFDFATLCAGPRSQNDYLEIANCYHTVILSDVPKMGAEMASEARRFTWLIDIFYDCKVKLLISAEVAPHLLYTEGAMAGDILFPTPTWLPFPGSDLVTFSYENEVFLPVLSNPQNQAKWGEVPTREIMDRFHNFFF